MADTTATMDGNTAVAHVAYRRQRGVRDLSDHALLDRWPSSPTNGRRKGSPTSWAPCRWCRRCRSEGGAAGAVHGALQSGALTTTFTASQGLLLMLPNMFKIAGELTLGGVPRGGAVDRDPGAVDLRRPSGRDGGALRRLRHAGGGLGAGGARLGAGCPGGDARGRACRSCISSTGSAPRTRSTSSTLLADDADPGDDRRRPRARPSRSGAEPGASVDPRHRAQSRHLLPGARDGEPLLRGDPGHRAGRDGPARRRSAGARYRLFHYDGHAGRRARRRLMGSGAEAARETAPMADGARREGRRAAGAASTGRSRPSISSQRCRRPCKSIAVLERTKEPGARASRSIQDVVATLAPAVGQRRSRPRCRG